MSHDPFNLHSKRSMLLRETFLAMTGSVHYDSLNPGNRIINDASDDFPLYQPARQSIDVLDPGSVLS